MAQLAKTTLLTSTFMPLEIVYGLFRCKESGVRKVMGSYRTYSIPGKTAALVQWKTCLLGQVNFMAKSSYFNTFNLILASYIENLPS